MRHYDLLFNRSSDYGTAPGDSLPFAGSPWSPCVFRMRPIRTCDLSRVSGKQQTYGMLVRRPDDEQSIPRSRMILSHHRSWRGPTVLCPERPSSSWTSMDVVVYGNDAPTIMSLYCLQLVSRVGIGDLRARATKTVDKHTT